VLQQRPMGVVPQAPDQILGLRAKVDDGAATAKRLSVRLAQDCATTGGDDVPAELRYLVDNFMFDIAKRSLTLCLEIVANRAADVLLDDVIRVNKREAKLPSNVAPDGGLATAGHADEGDQCRVVGSICRLRPHQTTLAHNAALADDAGCQEHKQLGAR